MTALIVVAVGLIWLAWIVAFRRGVRIGGKQGYQRGYHAAIDDGWAQWNRDQETEGL